MYSWLLQLLERVFYRPLSPSCTLALFKCWRRVWAVAIASQPENGDGKITRKELSDSLEKLNIHVPEKELIQMIEKIDVNGDGHVDMEEFGALYEALLDERGVGGDEEDMREAFNVFDQNSDGFITVEELRSVLVAMGLKQGRTVDDCKNMIAKVDVDGDGMVNYDEFRKMMKGGGFAASSPSD